MKGWVDHLFTTRPKPSGSISLCQCRLSPQQRQQLLEWPSKTSFWSLRNALDNEFVDSNTSWVPHSESQSLGLTVLWFASIYGQEHASEGEIWPTVAQAFPIKTRAALFVQGHPRPQLKAAMEEACQRFQLRNAFGRHGGQAYYLTVFLQFGFTRQGQAQLSNWLAGHLLPIPLRILLEECEEFRQCWQALREGRSLPENPFWPQGWQGKTAKTDHPDLPPQMGRLLWDSQIRFELDLQEVFPNLEDGAYLLEKPDLWIQVSDGCPEPRFIEVPSDQQQVSLSLGTDG